MTPQEIKQARSILGLTQSQFAERLGVSSRYIRKLEAGHRNPGNALQRIIEIELSLG